MAVPLQRRNAVDVAVQLSRAGAPKAGLMTPLHAECMFVFTALAVAGPHMPALALEPSDPSLRGALFCACVPPVTLVSRTSTSWSTTQALIT